MCIYVHHAHSLYLLPPEEGVGTPGEPEVDYMVLKTEPRTFTRAVSALNC